MDKNRGYWIAIGVGIGTALGVATDNMTVWIPLGITIGAVMSSLPYRSYGSNE